MLRRRVKAEKHAAACQHERHIEFKQHSVLLAEVRNRLSVREQELQGRTEQLQALRQAMADAESGNEAKQAKVAQLEAQLAETSRALMHAETVADQLQKSE